MAEKERVIEVMGAVVEEIIEPIDKEKDKELINSLKNNLESNIKKLLFNRLFLNMICDKIEKIEHSKFSVVLNKIGIKKLFESRKQMRLNKEELLIDNVIDSAGELENSMQHYLTLIKSDPFTDKRYILHNELMLNKVEGYTAYDGVVNELEKFDINYEENRSKRKLK